MRSPADATRFTATGPYAHSMPSPPPPSSSSATSSSNESPQAKVARLRAAAQRARLDQVSTYDKVVVTGRAWADRAHRFVAMGLIGATGLSDGLFSRIHSMLTSSGTALSALYATFALGDMVLYNRRKRAEFYATQRAQHDTHLAEAQAAADQYAATETQVELLKQEEKLQREAEAKKQRGLWARTKGLLFGGLKKEDGGVAADESLDMSSPAQETRSEGEVKGAASDGGILAAVTEHQRVLGEDARRLEQPKGGMLDRLGQDSSVKGPSNWPSGWGQRNEPSSKAEP